MLIQSSQPGSTEESVSLVYESSVSDWKTVDKSSHKCPGCEKIAQHVYENQVLLMDGKRNQSNSCSSSSLASCSQLSSLHTMDGNSEPTFVYRRRKPQVKSASVLSAQDLARLSNGSLSYISSEAPSIAAEESPVGSAVDLESITRAPVLNSESSNGCFGEAELCCVNDSYSSSKLNLELSPTNLRTEVDENCECSSSSTLVRESLQDNRSEKDICISILRNEWFLEGVWPSKVQSSKEPPGTTTADKCMRTCKVCQIQESTLEMLICDQCDEAFHVSCCNLRLEKIPIDDWFCYSCLKKKHKILHEIATKSLQIKNNKSSRSGEAMSENELGPIASMLLNIGPYAPGVRIGREFQADVPDWSGPCIDDIDTFDEPAKLDPSESLCLHNVSNLSRISSIGNWVQCRQVIEGIGDDVDGTICGKWRRQDTGDISARIQSENLLDGSMRAIQLLRNIWAPLFEVQTENWECFRAVLWDPSHADCAVPQEVDTDQVMKQLKYIEMLRPRLIAKKRKMDEAKDASLRGNDENARIL